MSLSTFSIFYYDFEIDDSTSRLDIDEGSGELTAQIDIGSYTPEDLAVKIETALNAVGTNTYVVTFNRSLRSYTIEADANFDLLISSGTSGSLGYENIGFSGPDLTGTDTYTGSSCGDFYEPQFVLQDYVDKEDFQKLVDPSVNKSASGRVEVIRFGTEKFFQMNIKFATNRPMDGIVIKNNPSGLNDLQRFMQYIIFKKPFEFMPNIGDRNTYYTCILESTPQEAKGTAYQLKELYDKNLPLIFETGRLVLRLVE